MNGLIQQAENQLIQANQRHNVFMQEMQTGAFDSTFYCVLKKEEEKQVHIQQELIGFCRKNFITFCDRTILTFSK